MQQRALVVIARAVERRQQEHADIGHGMLQAKHKLKRGTNAENKKSKEVTGATNFLRDIAIYG